MTSQTSTRIQNGFEIYKVIKNIQVDFTQIPYWYFCNFKLLTMVDYVANGLMNRIVISHPGWNPYHLTS